MEYDKRAYFKSRIHYLICVKKLPRDEAREILAEEMHHIQVMIYNGENPFLRY